MALCTSLPASFFSSCHPLRYFHIFGGALFFAGYVERPKTLFRTNKHVSISSRSSEDKSSYHDMTSRPLVDHNKKSGLITRCRVGKERTGIHMMFPSAISGCNPKYLEESLKMETPNTGRERVPQGLVDPAYKRLPIGFRTIRRQVCAGATPF